jgi:hypothetical protein
VNEDVRKYPLSIAYVGIAFTMATERNLKNLFYLNKEKDARIRDLEEQLLHAKKYEVGLKEFNLCA